MVFSLVANFAQQSLVDKLEICRSMQILLSFEHIYFEILLIWFPQTWNSTTAIAIAMIL